MYKMQMASEVITDKTISPVFQRTKSARGWIDVRADDIRKELARVCLITELQTSGNIDQRGRLICSL